MKKTIFMFGAIVLFFTTAVCWGAGFEIAGKTDGYAVRATFDKSQPTRGKNQVMITITDAESRPVRNVQVNVEYLMPSLPGKPPMMDFVTTAKPVEDKYTATLNLTMKGEWIIVVSIVTVAESKPAEAIRFALEVR